MNTRIVAVVYAMLVVIYVYFLSCVLSSDDMSDLYIAVSAVLFLVAFFSVHIYYKIEAIEDKLNKKRRSDKKNGRSRKKNKG